MVSLAEEKRIAPSTPSKAEAAFPFDGQNLSIAEAQQQPHADGIIDGSGIDHGITQAPYERRFSPYNNPCHLWTRLSHRGCRYASLVWLFHSELLCLQAPPPHGQVRSLGSVSDSVEVSLDVAVFGSLAAA